MYPLLLRTKIMRLVHAAVASIMLLFAFTLLLPPARAQAPILKRGDAVVTGFSGTVTPSSIPDGVDPLDLTTINLGGAAARIFDLEGLGQPPQGQLLGAKPAFDVKALDVGQVFGIALDDGKRPELGLEGPPNIYLTATSAFGLQIVGADGNGDGLPDRLKLGAPGAAWMPGQFGLDKGGGPGSVWRVDGQTGEVTLLANITLNGAANPGPALGNVAFDPRSRQLFVSDRATGMIHRLDLSGADLGYFDHGVEGRTAAGLPPVAHDPATALDITKPAFDATNSSTWAYAPAPRATWGVRVLGERLYYSVAEGPQIWSIGIAEDGSFAGDPRLEIEVADTDGDIISDITFDGDGMMYLAQRGAAKGDYAYKTFAEPKTARLIRYARETPDDPATPREWRQVAEEYAVGFPPEHRNTNGGVALGYGYRDGLITRGTCGRFVWTTGEALRQSSGLGEPENINGLQGHDRSLVRPANVPPTQTYFTDYDGRFDDPDVTGQIGDVEIWQPCEGRASFGIPGTPLFPPLPPSGTFNLTLNKVADPFTCVATEAGWQCNYTVRITNTGTVTYQGPLTIDERLPGVTPIGTSMSFAPQPPWNCVPVTPTHYQCTDYGLLLYPGESTSLDVSVLVPDTNELCYLDNGAAIVWPMGYGDANPYDDSDFATSNIPASNCPPPPPGDGTNLRLKKFSVLDQCLALPSGDYGCVYKVTVTNTGPGVYTGPVTVDDIPQNGYSAIFEPSPPWACVGASPYSCTHPATVLNPGEGLELAVGVIVPKADVKPGQCKIRNRAIITDAPGGSPKNWFPGDDADEAVADIIAPECVKPETNLRIEKVAIGDCKRGSYPPYGSGFACVYGIRVTNTGPGIYNGLLELTDTLSAPGIATVFNPTPPWNCAGAGVNWTCQRPGTLLNPGQHVDLLVGHLVAPDVVKENKCKIRNVAKITKAPGGSPQNTNPADDQADATAVIAGDFCGKKETNLKIEKTPKGCRMTTGGRPGPAHVCGFRIKVTNTGPGVYSGPIVVADQATGPASMTMTMSPQPPWSCVMAGTNATCTLPAAVLNPGQSVQLTAITAVPERYLEPGQCKIDNRVQILQAPGGTPSNTNAGDDQSSASTTITSPKCQNVPPPVPQQPGRVSIDKTCTAVAVGGSSTCTVTVRNDGPGALAEDVVFTDAAVYIGTGAQLGIQSATPDGGDWTCTGLPSTLNCRLPSASLPASASRSVTVVMQPLAAGQGPEVRFRNCARTTTGQEACAEAGGDISVVKTAPASCQPGSPCTFGITITNTGSAPFSGTLMLADMMLIDDGVAADGTAISSIVPPLGCDSEPASLPFSCLASMSLAAGESRTHQFTVQLPGEAGRSAEMGRNCFMAVDQRVAGSVRLSGNVLPSGNGPGYSCVDVPIKSVIQPCPGDLVRIGTQCKCPEQGQRRVGDQCIGSRKPLKPQPEPQTDPDLPPPVVQTCKAPLVGTFPNCRCPSGSTLRNGRCVEVDRTPDPKPEKCDPPRLGIKPNCRCPNDRPTWTGQTCVKLPVVEKCDPPRIGTKPNCRCPSASAPIWDGKRCVPKKPVAEKCDPPRIGTKPNCRCPNASAPVWDGKRCVPKQPSVERCDPPKVGIKPNCRCPQGTVPAGSGCRKPNAVDPQQIVPKVIEQLLKQQQQKQQRKRQQQEEQQQQQDLRKQ